MAFHEISEVIGRFAGLNRPIKKGRLWRAHGNFIADMLHQASDIKFGKYYDASVVFMKDATVGTAAYGGSLFAQPAPGLLFARAVSDSHPSVTLAGVGDPSASHNNGLL